MEEKIVETFILPLYGSNYAHIEGKRTFTVFTNFLQIITAITSFFFTNFAMSLSIFKKLTKLQQLHVNLNKILFDTTTTP